MKSKLLHEAPERTLALVFDEGDEVLAQLKAYFQRVTDEKTGLPLLSL